MTTTDDIVFVVVWFSINIALSVFMGIKVHREGHGGFEVFLAVFFTLIFGIAAALITWFFLVPSRYNINTLPWTIGAVLLSFIPFIGWIIWLLLWYDRVKEAREDLAEAQKAARQAPPSEWK